MRKPQSLDVDLRRVDLRFLTEAEQVRHILVHNGGIVSREFQKRTGRGELPIGSKYQLSEDYLNSVSLEVRNLGSAVFKSVLERAFVLGEDDKPALLFFNKDGVLRIE